MNKRAQFAATMEALLDERMDVTVLLGDIGVHSFRHAFGKHPSRCINIGICEGASVSLAAGLSASGLYPVFSTIESFLLRRAFEQLFLDFGIQKLPGLFVGIGGANEYAKLGPTHQCEHGLRLAREIPGMQIYQPA